MGITDWACADEAAHVFAFHKDSLTFLRTLPDNWCHAIITDPPYGLADHKPDRVIEALTAWSTGDRERVPTGRGFMGREWDAFVPPPALWDECLRVLKPGGHLAVFAGSRTVDLMGLSIRLAGFEMRDGVAAWLYGSGFPKSLDVGKAIDAKAGATREVVGRGVGVASVGYEAKDRGAIKPAGQYAHEYDVTAPATDAAREWQGWGTALKPAHEPILLARKPLAGTVAANVLAHRAGGINVDACRVAGDARPKMTRTTTITAASSMAGVSTGSTSSGELTTDGRWPTNVVLAHHPECGPDERPGPCVAGCQVAALDEQSGTLTSGVHAPHHKRSAPGGNGETHGAMAGVTGRSHADTGGASRFFPTFRYQAKAPKRERPEVDGRGHPTVKPLGLMRWLVRLLVPDQGMVIDPFAGSGSTLEAARLEGARAVGIERDEHSVALIAARLGVEVRS